ncbi:hypothetical protein HMPREF0742_02170 [Rothia aeria F0184]|uniref:Uncharacterized protein n=1 Tax=Rothia aeria F0184 TaxID=888019 RepID=U7UZS1_9MICC|nr:hypothetical protein HMPREF0742_02170 [Rothia aeria F0184]
MTSVNAGKLQLIFENARLFSSCMALIPGRMSTFSFRRIAHCEF